MAGMFTFLWSLSDITRINKNKTTESNQRYIISKTKFWRGGRNVFESASLFQPIPARKNK